MIEEVKPADFDSRITSSSKPIAVLFHAEWCPFCRNFRPHFIRYSDRADFSFVEVKLNEDENPLWERFEIKIVPTIVVFMNGRQIFRADGAPGIGLEPEILETMLREVERHIIEAEGSGDPLKVG